MSDRALKLEKILNDFSKNRPLEASRPRCGGLRSTPMPGSSRQMPEAEKTQQQLIGRTP